MSKIEDLVYSAYEHGQRERLFEKVKEIKITNPTLQLEAVYERAYADVMNT
tara:strand:+ start:329 stop:481 length:153 start_codon:yes stop_codon:yes gene_type:complete